MLYKNGADLGFADTSLLVNVDILMLT